MISVALIGCGLVGKSVVHQLTSPTLAPLFRIISLSNSKYTISLTPAASSLLASADALLALLPPSSGPLPTVQLPQGVSQSLSEPAKLVQELVKESDSTGVQTILIDCTSDLNVTLLYPAAIAAGLSVVTPNKKGFSSASSLWLDILNAEKSGPKAGLVYLEATVGAGLPIISTLRDLVKTGDEVSKIEGVLSGTLSYIFNEFSKPEGSTAKFSEIVKIAKDNGYTEPHPADDLSGSDVARKLTILTRLLALSPSAPSLPSLPEGFASLSTTTLIPAALADVKDGNVFVEKLKEHDAEFDKLRDDAMKEGKVLRYVGVIDGVSGEVKCSLEKYSFSHPFAASLGGSDNIIAFHTKRYESRPLIVQGAAAGAGAAVTAMGVVADAIKVAERLGTRTHL